MNLVNGWCTTIVNWQIWLLSSELRSRWPPLQKCRGFYLAMCRKSTFHVQYVALVTLLMTPTNFPRSLSITLALISIF